MLTVTISGRG